MSQPNRMLRLGFTLVELMVAVAVTIAIMAMLAQMMLLVSSAWSNGRQDASNFTKARSMLSLLATDLQMGLFRNDLAAFPACATSSTGSTQAVEFYTQRPGFSSGTSPVRNVSLINYAFIADETPPLPTSTLPPAFTLTTLERGDLALPWPRANTSLPLTFGNITDFGNNTPTPRDTAAGVIDFELLFVYADGTVSRTYSGNTSATTNPVRTFGITLAIVDNQTLGQLSTQQITNLRTELNGAVTGLHSVKADWETDLAQNLNWSQYPKSMRSGLRVFERYVAIAGF